MTPLKFVEIVCRSFYCKFPARSTCERILKVGQYMAKIAIRVWCFLIGYSDICKIMRTTESLLSPEYFGMKLFYNFESCSVCLSQQLWESGGF